MSRSAPQNSWLLRALVRLVALSIPIALVSACGGGDDDDSGGSTTTATATQSAGASSTPEESGDGSTDSIQVNETFYHAGFEVTLGQASIVDSVVQLKGIFKNLSGTDNASLDSRLALRSGGNDYIDISDFDQDLPAVSAHGQKTGTIAIRVDDEFSFDDATLFVGNPDNNQAIIPLGPDSDEDLITLEPQELTVSGQVIAGPVTVDVEGGQIRADLPEKYSIADKDHLELTLRFAVTPGTGIPIGEGVFQDPNVQLRTPDGTVVAVRDDGVSGVNELLQGREGTTIDDLSVRFEVKKPVPGEYAFIVKGNWGADRAEVKGELAFTVPALPTLGE